MLTRKRGFQYHQEKESFNVWMLSFPSVCNLIQQQMYWGKLLLLFAQVLKIMGTVLHKSAKLPSRTSVEIFHPYEHISAKI